MHPKICSKGYKCAYEGEHCSCYGTVTFDKTFKKEVDGQIKCSEDEFTNIPRNTLKRLTDVLKECSCEPNGKSELIFDHITMTLYKEESQIIKMNFISLIVICSTDDECLDNNKNCQRELFGDNSKFGVCKGIIIYV